MAKSEFQPLLIFILGTSMAYHAQSTWLETHLNQTDLIKTGWLFVWLFLPAANLLMIMFLLTSIPDDALSFSRSMGYVWSDIINGYGLLKE